jgi:flagellar hook-length control protein FliK
MARVTPESSLGRLSLDIAVAPSQKNGIDPTLMGAFDETLRQARRSEPESAVDVAMPARETRRADEARDSNASSDREPRERDEARVEEADTTSASDGETRSSDEVESNDTGTDSEVNPDDTTEHAEVEEDGAESDESPNETEANTAVVGAPVVEEPGVQAAEEGVPKEGQGEQVSSANRVGEAAESQTPDSNPAEAAGEPTVDEATVTTEEMSETVEMTQENAGEETESEDEQKTAGSESAKANGSDEKSDADTTMNQSETANAASDLAGTSGEVLPDGETRQKADRRTTSTRGERREASATQASGAQVGPTDVAQPTPAEGGAVESQLQNVVAAGDAVAPPPEAAAADLGTTHNASQPTGSADVVTGVESRSSTTQGQANAGQATGKGTEAGVDPAKFVQRVANAFSALGQRNGPVRLKLYPPELGSLRMEITVKNGTLSAKVEAETAAARVLLVDNLPMLRERLAEQGIKVDRFDVGVSDQSQGGPSERSDDGGRSSRQSGRESEPQNDHRGSETNPNEQRDERRVNVDGRLDVFI